MKPSKDSPTPLPEDDGLLADAGYPPAEADPVVPKKKGSALRKLIVLTILVGGGLWTARFIHERIAYETTDDAYVTGRIHNISPGIAGPLSEVLADDNQLVKAGQVVARIDPLEFQIMVTRAKAAEAQARAHELQVRAALAEAKAGDLQADAQIASAEAQVAQTEAQLNLANINYHRNEGLSHGDTRAVSESELDSTRGIVATTSASVDAAKAGLAAAKARKESTAAAIDSATAEIGAAKASTEAASGAVREAERQLSLVTVIAPANGRIGNKNAEVGNRVQTGQPLFALVEPNYWIVGNFKETQLKSMKVGQAVEITIDAVDGRSFTGKIDSVSPSTGAQFALLPPDNATGNFTKVVQRVPVKIVFDADSIKGFEDKLSPGLSTVLRVKVK